MIITDIKKGKAHTVQVFLSDNTDFSLDTDVCAEAALKKGGEINKEQVKRLCEKSDYVRAKSRALWFLDRADRTEKQLFDKLKAAGFGEESIEKALSNLKEYGLIDDNRYALNLAERCIAAGKSKREIYFKLMQKGVPKGIISEVLSESGISEEEQIALLLRKKYANKLCDKESVSRVYAALVRKGFSYGAVRNALKKYNEQTEFEEDYEDF